VCLWSRFDDGGLGSVCVVWVWSMWRVRPAFLFCNCTFLCMCCGGTSSRSFCCFPPFILPYISSLASIFLFFFLHSISSALLNVALYHELSRLAAYIRRGYGSAPRGPVGAGFILVLYWDNLLCRRPCFAGFSLRAVGHIECTGFGRIAVARSGHGLLSCDSR